MVTEKPMSASLSDALRMVRAVKANDVKLMVNWPITWSPAVRKMKELIDEGMIGDVWEVKWRNGASMGPLSYIKGDDAFTGCRKRLRVVAPIRTRRRRAARLLLLRRVPLALVSSANRPPPPSRSRPT